MASPIIFNLHHRPPPTALSLSSCRSIVPSSVHGVLPRSGASPYPASSSSSSFSSSSSLRPLLRLRGKERGSSLLTCFYNAKEEDLEPNPTEKGSDVECPVLRRWDVPWDWPTVSLTMLGCAISFALTGLVGSSVLPYLGFQPGTASLDEIAEVLFAGQFSGTAAILGVIFGITNTFKPFSDDIFRYDLQEPFKLQNGWLLWAAIGLVGALIAIGLLGVGLNSLSGGGSPQRETDALIRLLPLIGSSSISTACLLGVTGVLAPVLEETVFRGFLMVSLTKWFPTPVAILISAAIFAVAHLTPGEIPQLFVLGTALGLTYAQTRNLLTPITTHALWNSGVILFLTFLQLRGYDIKELLQAS